MAIVVAPGSSQGSLAGTGIVTVVPAPAAGVRRSVRSIRFDNIDTAAVTIMVSKTVGGVSVQFDSAARIPVNGKFVPVWLSDVVNLTTEFQSITAVMSAAPLTVQPTFVCTFIDYAVVA